METLEQILAEHPFLKGLPSSHLHFVAECASKVEFDSETHLFHEGKAADQFYLIQKGQVALGTFIPGRGFIIIQTLDKGEIVGWSWLVPSYEWRFDARTITPVQAIVIDGKRLRERCEADHDFGYEILKRLALVIGQRLTATRLRLEA